MAHKKKSGRCYLVGAGPGDLGLVTLRARQLIERADVLVYDYLCNPEMLAWAPEQAEIIYAGKKPARTRSSRTKSTRSSLRKHAGVRRSLG